MIRPLTFLTAALALGSGFYLYQAKHRTQLLDARISAIAQQTVSAENRIAVLRAEWALENAPSRLADLAAHYLLLVPMAPSQAVSMANLAAHLPPPAEGGSTPPVAGEPDLVATADTRLLARYASLTYFATQETPAATTPAAVAHLAAPPPAATVALRHAPPAPVTPGPATPAPVTPAPGMPADQHTPPATPGTLARLSPPKESAPGENAPAAGPRPAPRAARPALVAATPAPLHARPTPILTSALGGSYPALPPPAPLSGSH